MYQQAAAHSTEKDATGLLHSTVYFQHERVLPAWKRYKHKDLRNDKESMHNPFILIDKKDLCSVP
jgi:hypothetical protein